MVKKTPTSFKGNKVNQNLKSPFVAEFNKWREHCQRVSNSDMKVKKIPNLYMFLKRHFVSVRGRSRNASFEGEGVNELLTVIENAVDNALFTVGNAKIIKQLAVVLKEWENTGSVEGEGIAADPAFILFTEKVKGRTGQRLKDKTVQGHYMTEEYAGENKVPDEWLSGNNPPHEALYSKTSGPFSQPRGLLYIMEDATKEFNNQNTDGIADIGVEINSIPAGYDASDFEQLGEIEKYFDSVVRNNALWNTGGRLLDAKLRRDFEAREFILKEKDQAIIRELARLGKRDDPKAIAGKVTTFRLVATATPLITLVDRALKRKGTNKAPNGYIAWQNKTKRGFDYRKTAEEKWGKNTGKGTGRFRYKPDAKVISKMWQTLLWRR